MLMGYPSLALNEPAGTLLGAAHPDRHVGLPAAAKASWSGRFGDTLAHFRFPRLAQPGKHAARGLADQNSRQIHEDDR